MKKNMILMLLGIISVLVLCSCNSQKKPLNIQLETTETTEITETSSQIKDKELFLSAIQVSDMFINAYQDINIEKMESFMSEDYYITDKCILNKNDTSIYIPIVGYERNIDDIVLNNYYSNSKDNSVWIQYHIRSYNTNQTFLLGITLNYISNNWIINAIEVY